MNFRVASRLGSVPPKYFATRDLATSDLNVRADRSGKQIPAERARRLVEALNAEGYWPTPLVSQSHPYTGARPPAKPDGDYAETHVGDLTDTSPYPVKDAPLGISTGAYIQNMSVLIDYLTGGR